MIKTQEDEETPFRQKIVGEEVFLGKLDENGNRWTKVHFDNGARLRNCLSQFVELKDEKRGEKIYRIWIKDTDVGEGNEQM